jgi:quercetin dioxygenase-like cupin family protein
MPILTSPAAATHEMHGARFTSLASPQKGTHENCVWTVELAPGAPTTPHQLTREEILVILAGRASVVVGAERREVGAGDVVVVPPNTPFELAVVGDAAVRAFVCLPVGGKARLADGTTFTPPWAE